MSDTHPDAERVLIEGYRRMTIAQKLRIAEELGRLAYARQLADTRRRYPNATERELELRVASRWLDAETMRRAFGWDPDREGM